VSAVRDETGHRALDAAPAGGVDAPPGNGDDAPAALTLRALSSDGAGIVGSSLPSIDGAGTVGLSDDRMSAARGWLASPPVGKNGAAGVCFGKKVPPRGSCETVGSGAASTITFGSAGTLTELRVTVGIGGGGTATLDADCREDDDDDAVAAAGDVAGASGSFAAGMIP
jgi:hypothetical protein